MKLISSFILLKLPLKYDVIFSKVVTWSLYPELASCFFCLLHTVIPSKHFKIMYFEITLKLLSFNNRLSIQLDLFVTGFTHI